MNTPKPESPRPHHRQTHEEISLRLIEQEQSRSKELQQGKEVSCLALDFFFDYLEANGLSRDAILYGLPYTPEYLNNRLNWIDYETFCTIERRLADHFDDPDLYYKVGCSFQNTGGLGFVRVIMRSVLSPFKVYALIPRMLRRFLFPNVNAKYLRTGKNELVGTYVFNPGFAPSMAWIETTRGILASIPTMMGAPAADVSVVRDNELTIIFTIRLHRWLGPVEALKGAVSKLTSTVRMRLDNARDAGRELENANALLQAKVDELTAAQATLTSKVRDLSVLNQLSLEATGHLELNELVRTAVRVISSELGDLPNALLLRDAELDSWQIGATCGLNAQEVQALDRDLASNKFTAPFQSGEPEASSVHGWVPYPMHIADRQLGALLVPKVHADSVDMALFHSIANQMAIAIDNAISYRVITDLRDNLEVRVEERTAQLEDARSKLEDTVVKLEEADRSKREFFTNVSHELKTPLTLIMAPLDELRQSTTNIAALDSLGRNASTLHQLVEELLDFSKLDDGRFEVKPIHFDLKPFADDILGTLSPLAKQRSISLNNHIASGTYPVLAEPRLMRRILRNLVSNAIKYIGDNDEVTVSITSDLSYHCLEVSDNGPGISDADKARIFERFFRCPTTKRQVKGSGIGLAMARDLAELCGGSLTVSDTPGGGATFRLTVPVAESQATLVDPTALDSDADTAQLLSLVSEVEAVASSTTATALRAEGNTGHGLKVLVVDDNPDIRALMRRLLSDTYDVVEAPNGSIALDVAKSTLPDLVLSDVSMPGMSGYELCRQLKSFPETKNVPVLLVTARHGSEAAVQGFEHGADDYITKPFSPTELLARVNAHIRIRSLTVALIRAEKQASLGAMSAGIAHQILNPVSVVVNAVPPLRRAIAGLHSDLPDEKHLARSEKMLKAIETSGGRISKVVDAVLRLARQDAQGVVFRPTSIREHLDSVTTMLGYRISQGFEVSTDFQYDGYVDCVPDLLDQAVLNLLNNAMDAMGTEGHITLATEQRDANLVIRVSDTGPGVPKTVRRRIFNPFFSTKGPGQNAGLGLALVSEIVNLHSGSVGLVATSDQGSTFEIEVPLSQVLVTER